jgi:integrase
MPQTPTREPQKPQKLTKRLVDATKAPRSGEVKVWDAEIKGFGLRVRSSGRRTFILQYRNAAGRTRRLSIGEYGSPWTVQKARAEATQLLAAVRRGEDPQAERAQEREVLTLAQLAEKFLSEHVEQKRKPRTAREYQRLLEDHLLPALGTRSVADVTRGDIARLHHALRETPTQANRLVAVASSMFARAERWGLRPEGSNPCRHVDRFKERGRQRFLSPAELAKLGEVLADPESGESPVAVAALRLLLLTGMRLGEVRSLAWADVDLERGLLILADSKTGERPVLLGAAALALLSALPRQEGSPWVFPSERTAGHWIGLRKVWYRVRDRAGLGDVRLHDLRHSFAAVAASGGMSLPLIGALLGHSQPQTTARYAHLQDSPLRGAADRVSGEIAAALGGGGGEVVAFREGRS